MHADKAYTVSIGFGAPTMAVPREHVAEVFISGTKVGSDVEAIARDAAVVLSIALQYAVPLITLAGAVTRGRNNEPSTIIGAVIDRLQEEAKDK